MSRDRDDVRTRRAPPKIPAHPDALLIRRALQRLTGSPDWAIFIDHYKAREFEAWFNAGALEAGALSVMEGRRSFLRELEALPKRLTDDDRSDQHG